jgi:Holliday junction DNA helicase RuvA
MIGRLRGEVVSKHPPFLMLEVNGVGYEVEAPMSTFYNLPPLGEQATLLTHLVVRDDAHVLYAFGSESERALFRALLKVSGVGAKMALAILSGMSAEAFASCVKANDVSALVRLPGIGKKTAERLIVEMRDRLEKLGMAQDFGVASPVSAQVPGGNPVTEAIEALTALGYKPNDANRMVGKVEQDGLSSEELIRAALKSVAG